MLVFTAILAILLAAALTARDTSIDTHLNPQTTAQSQSAAVPAPNEAAPQETKQRDPDLALYNAIADRVAAGDNYYSAAVAEQRARNYPLQPGLTVRLPTLAYLKAMIGDWALFALAVILTGGTLIAWHYRLRDEPGGPGQLRYILLLVVSGAMTGLKPQYLVLHEVWAGLLIALSLGLYRPGKWLWAVLAAAAALSIRELALPFVTLMGVLAFMRGRRLEAGAWAIVFVLFIAALAVHLSIISGLTNASDPVSSSWLTWRGLAGWTSNVVLTSPLYLAPFWLAAPIALLPLIGWAGWKSEFGLTGFLLCAGYGVMFMIAGRDNNFYWGLLIMPVWFVGLAFTPRAIASLWNSARGM